MTNGVCMSGVRTLSQPPLPPRSHNLSRTGSRVPRCACFVFVAPFEDSFRMLLSKDSSEGRPLCDNSAAARSLRVTGWKKAPHLAWTTLRAYLVNLAYRSLIQNVCKKPKAKWIMGNFGDIKHCSRVTENPIFNVAIQPLSAEETLYNAAMIHCY